MCFIVHRELHVAHSMEGSLFMSYGGKDIVLHNAVLTWHIFKRSKFVTGQSLSVLFIYFYAVVYILSVYRRTGR